MLLRNHDYTGDLVPIAIGNKPKHWDIEWLDNETPPGFDRPALAPESQVPGPESLPASEHPIFLPQGGRVWKVFKGSAPIYHAVSQLVTGLVAGAEYLFKIPVHLDIYKWSGKKVYPTDGYAAEARVGFGDTWDTVTWADWQNPITNPDIMPDDRRLAFGEYSNVWMSFVAQADSVRLWLECKAKYADQSNNFFIYHATLEQISEPEPEPPERRWSRTAWLIPQDATWDEAMGAFVKAFENKNTLTWSADDALVADEHLTNRTVFIPYNRFPSDILEFADNFYPGAEIVLEGEKVRPLPEPEPPEPEPTSHTLVTAHISGKLGAFEIYLKTAKPRGIKMIAWDVRTVYNWHPEIEAIILRKWYNNNPSHDYFLNAQEKAKVAKEYVDLVLGELPQEAQWLYDQGWRGRIGLESLNEPYCNLCEANAKARDFEIAFCHELMSRGIPLVVPACMNAGVGNPHHDGENAEIIEPIAKVLGQYNGFWCTHNYGPVWQGVSHLEDQWEWYAGRVDWWLNILKQEGVSLFFTEGGPITGAPPKYQPQEYGGWKTSNCFNGDWIATRMFLLRLNQLLNEKYGDMCFGDAIFATGESEQWEKTFGIGKIQWDDLANQF